MIDEKNPVHKDRKKLITIIAITVIAMLLIGTLLLFTDTFVGQAISVDTSGIENYHAGFVVKEGSFIAVGKSESFPIYVNLRDEKADAFEITVRWVADELGLTAFSVAEGLSVITSSKTANTMTVKGKVTDSGKTIIDLQSGTIQNILTIEFKAKKVQKGAEIQILNIVIRGLSTGENIITTPVHAVFDIVDEGQGATGDNPCTIVGQVGCDVDGDGFECINSGEYGKIGGTCAPAGCVAMMGELESGMVSPEDVFAACEGMKGICALLKETGYVCGIGEGDCFMFEKSNVCVEGLACIKSTDTNYAADNYVCGTPPSCPVQEVWDFTKNNCFKAVLKDDTFDSVFNAVDIKCSLDQFSEGDYAYCTQEQKEMAYINCVTSGNVYLESVKDTCTAGGIPEQCDNGIDDDNNGATDCDDTSCSTHPACVDDSSCPIIQSMGGSVSDCIKPYLNDDYFEDDLISKVIAGGECDPAKYQGQDYLGCTEEEKAFDYLTCQVKGITYLEYVTDTCTAGGTPEFCENGIDDDQDGDIDCAGSNCNLFKACTDAGVSCNVTNDCSEFATNEKDTDQAICLEGVCVQCETDTQCKTFGWGDSCVNNWCTDTKADLIVSSISNPVVEDGKLKSIDVCIANIGVTDVTAFFHIEVESRISTGEVYIPAGAEVNSYIVSTSGGIHTVGAPCKTHTILPNLEVDPVYLADQNKIWIRATADAATTESLDGTIDEAFEFNNELSEVFDLSLGGQSECTQDVECGPAELCSEGVCGPSQLECNDDSSCQEGKVCTNHKCAEPGESVFIEDMMTFAEEHNEELAASYGQEKTFTEIFVDALATFLGVFK